MKKPLRFLLAALFALVGLTAWADEPVMSQFSNRKVYAIKNNSTGNYLMAPSGAEYLWTSAKKGTAYDKKDGAFQWLVFYTTDGYLLYNIGSGKVANDTKGTSGSSYHWNLVDPATPSYIVATTDGTTFAFHDKDYSSGNMWLHNNETYSTGITNWTETGPASRWVIEEILEVPEANAASVADVKAYMESYEWPADPEPEPDLTLVELDNLETGWYQMKNLVSAWAASAQGKNLSTLEISQGILHNSDYYDVVTTDNSTDLNTLFYVEKTGTAYTIALPTGYKVGKGCSRTNWNRNSLTIAAPDDDQTRLRLYNSQGGNYWEMFSKNGYLVVGAGSTAKNGRFTFHTTDDLLNGLAIYKVAYGDGVTGTPEVTYTNATYTGVKTVIENGVYFLADAPSSSDFTSTDAGGVPTKVVVDTEAKTLTVVLSVTMSDMAAAATAARAVLNLRGVGYPSNTCTEYYELNNAITAVEEATSPSVALLNTLDEKLTAYKTTDNFQKPEVGGGYRINVISSADNSSLGYVNYAEAGINVAADSEDAVVECVSIEDGKYVFRFAKSCKYLVYKNGRGASESGAGVNENKGWSNEYEASYAAFNIATIASSTHVTKDVPFGCVSLITAQRNATDSSLGCLIVKNETLSFDTSTAPFFNGTFTSAFMVEDATDALATIKAAIEKANLDAGTADMEQLAALQEKLSAITYGNEEFISSEDNALIKTILGDTYTLQINDAFEAANNAGVYYVSPIDFDALSTQIDDIITRITVAKTPIVESTSTGAKPAADEDYDKQDCPNLALNKPATKIILYPDFLVIYDVLGVKGCNLKCYYTQDGKDYLVYKLVVDKVAALAPAATLDDVDPGISYGSSVTIGDNTYTIFTGGMIDPIADGYVIMTFNEGYIKYVWGELATAISEANASTESGAIYNLNGQRVNKAQNGLYIINGKKVVVK